MSFTISNAVKALGIVALVFMALSAAGPSAVAQTATVQVSKSPASGTSTYKLDTGDKVKVTVYGEDDLSGVFEVDGSGNVRLPLIGQIRAAGLSVRDLEASVAAALAKGYLVDPKVSVEVATYRPFTILGEVNKPGEYPYEAGMTVLNAVALGGGYTYRADEDEVYIRRKGSTEEAKLPADDRTPVYPGDTVRVDERIF